MVEDTHCRQEPGVRHGVVRLVNSATVVKPEMNIMRRATSIRRGQVVLRCGTVLRPAELGLLAEAGRRQARVATRPRMAVLATGNELVDAALKPGPAQIRNSNGPLLLAWGRQHGAATIDLGIARDDRQHLAARITEGLGADLFVLSGGVSAGVLDLVPDVLAGLGVRQLFHKVAIRPGRPVWFGVFEGGAGTTLVFGLPGNPVGTLVCCELLVAEAMGRLCGRSAAVSPHVTATLENDYRQHGQRATYHPANLWIDGAAAKVRIVPWRGSGDLRALSEANAWAIFPPGDRHYNQGDQVACRPMLA
jgi:molybdopterin molybdotransferase